MGSAVIFAGSAVKTLKSQISLNGANNIITSTTDPTASAVDAAIGSLLMNSSNGKLYRKNDSGSSTNWTEVGASGQAGINYIANPNAATNTTGWNTYADAAGAQPVDGTGGSPNVTWTRSTTTPLRGAADFVFAKDAANRQGQGVSVDFTIDNADIAKPLTVTFDYEVVSGTYATGDLTVYLIADPSGTPVIIQPAGYQIQSATASTKMRNIATFQTQASGVTYRLCLHVASTSASAYDLAIDNVVVGPQVVQYGAPVTDWVSYTPTGSWTSNVTYTGKYRRVGDSLQVDVGITCSGAPTSATLTVNLPSGITIDTAKLNLTGNDNCQLGAGVAVDTGVNSYPLVVNYSSTTAVKCLILAASGTYANETPLNATVPITFGNTDTVQLNFIVPVAGWSSTVQMSNDTDTRVVAANAALSSNWTHNSTGNFLKVPFNQVTFDTHGAWDSSNYKYTVAVPGFYSVAANLLWSANGTGVRSLQVYKNGSYYSDLASASAAGLTTNGMGPAGSQIMKLVAGDYIEFYASQNSGGNLATFGTAAANFCNIQRLSGPSAIAASETVAMRYTNTAGTSIATGSGSANVSFATKVYDTHGAWSGTSFTAPVSGKYQVNCHVFFGSASWTITAKSIQLVKAGSSSLTEYLSLVVPAANYTSGLGIAGSTTIDLIAGDTLGITLQHNEAATKSLDTTGGVNVLSITRIGN